MKCSKQQRRILFTHHEHNKKHSSVNSYPHCYFHFYHNIANVAPSTLVNLAVPMAIYVLLREIQILHTWRYYMLESDANEILPLREAFSFPLSQHVYEPLCRFLLLLVPSLSLIPANTYSLLGVCSSAATAAMLTSVKLGTRQFGLIFFFIRAMLDTLDDIVAEEQLASLNKEAGSLYPLWTFVDSFCDSVSYALIMVAIFVFFQAAGTAAYFPSALPSKRSFSLVCAQVYACGLLWSYFSNTSKQHLTSPVEGIAEDLQREIFCSWLAQIYFLIWRLLNPECLMHACLFALAVDRLKEFVVAIKSNGFLLIGAASTVSYIYSKYVLVQLHGSGAVV